MCVCVVSRLPDTLRPAHAFYNYQCPGIAPKRGQGPPMRRCMSRLMRPCGKYSNGPGMPWACVCWYPSASVSTASNASRQYRISPATPSFEESTFQAEHAGNTLYGSEACSCCREVPATDALTPVTGRQCVPKPALHHRGPGGSQGCVWNRGNPGTRCHLTTLRRTRHLLEQRFRRFALHRPAQTHQERQGPHCPRPHPFDCTNSHEPRQPRTRYSVPSRMLMDRER